MAYRLYVDEVGNDDLGHAEDERHRYFSLTGVAVRREEVLDIATPRLDRFKAEFFRHDPDVPVVLHRKDILQFKGPFELLRDDERRREFDRFILAYLEEVDYTVITAVIDKLEMQRQPHWLNQHPYHYLLEILVEKYVQWLERRGARGDIMPERRRGKKDTALQRAYEEVRAAGTDFVERGRIQRRLPAKKLKFRGKSDNVTGLQICDLIAHPSYLYVRREENHAVNVGPFAQRVVAILERHKYDRREWDGRIRGYGTKYLPPTH